jgi:hypothetical protein
MDTGGSLSLEGFMGEAVEDLRGLCGLIVVDLEWFIESEQRWIYWSLRGGN